jgi:predicted small metal-binding protein
MKEFSCGDLIPGCGARFHGQNDDEILAQVAVHARRDHGLESIPDSLVSQVRQLISVAA